MKRAGNLYPQIYLYDNLVSAFHKAARGKRGRADVMVYYRNLDGELERLRQELMAHRPRVGAYRFFKIHDPKPRSICAAAFPERVLHHAVMNVCEPVFERYAIYDSYACRRGKGNLAALERARGFSRRFPWYLKLDVEKYFDSVDHDILMALLERRFKDGEVLELFRRILDSYHHRPGRGLPIGNLMSQHWANFYLGHLDHWIKEAAGVQGYVRYMDDMIVWGRSRRELKERYSEIRAFLWDELHLRPKGSIQLNQCRYGIPFLGFRVFPHGFRLGRARWRRTREKSLAARAAFEQGRWDETDLSRHGDAVIGSLKPADSPGVRRRIFQFGKGA